MEENVNILLAYLKKGYRIYWDKYYNNLSDCLGNIKSYLLMHPELKNEIEILVNVLCDGNSKNVFYVYDNLDSAAPDYAYAFQEIIKEYNNDVNMGIRTFKKYNYSLLHSISYYLKNFKKKYINADLFIPTLSEINEIVKKEKREERKGTSLKVGKYTRKFTYSVINTLYDSGLSLLDYAFYNVIDYRAYNEILNNNKDSTLVQEILNRENKTLPLVDDVINKLNNKELDIIDYYELCKINKRQLRYISTKHNLTKVLFENGMKPTYYAPVRLESELNSTMVINGQEVSNKIKAMAIKHLEELGVPVVGPNYMTMVKKLVNKKK